MKTKNIQAYVGCYADSLHYNDQINIEEYDEQILEATISENLLKQISEAHKIMQANKFIKNIAIYDDDLDIKKLPQITNNWRYGLTILTVHNFDSLCLNYIIYGKRDSEEFIEFEIYLDEE